MPIGVRTMQNTIKIYVRPGSWDFHIISEDDYNRFSITGNKDTMDCEVYKAGWEAYRDKQIETGATVSVHHIS
jgi:hypothetical protein